MEMGALAAVDAVLGIFADVLIAIAATGFGVMILAVAASCFLSSTRHIASTAAGVGAVVWLLSLLVANSRLNCKAKSTPVIADMKARQTINSKADRLTPKTVIISDGFSPIIASSLPQT